MDIEAAVRHVDATGLTGNAQSLVSRYEEPGFPTLCRIIAFQQLTGAQALRMCHAVEARYPSFPSPEDFVAGDAASVMVRAGVAPFRAAAMEGLARSVLAGSLKIPVRAGDDLGALAAVKGIGPWTIDMFRLFALRDLDVWPVDDLGLQKGLRLHGAQGQPAPDDGGIWAPYRSVATWFLWQKVPGFPTPGFRPEPGAPRQSRLAP